MKTIVVAIHGILTSQTDASWPDRLDAWMFQRDPEVKVLKKEYAAGPFPRWNCWVKDPHLARSLATELELFLTEALPPIWLVAHSNGAVIALLVTKRLIEGGHQIGGLILTGAACEAEVEKNGVRAWCDRGALGAAIAYSSREDLVLDGDPRCAAGGDAAANQRRGVFFRIRAWLWGRAMWPYGCLGRTGWLENGKPVPRAEADPSLAGDPAASEPGARPQPHISLLAAETARAPRIFTRWFRGGHGAYFRPEQIESTFERIYGDIHSATRATRGPELP